MESGFSHAHALWGEANKKVKLGRPAPPLTIDLEGSAATYAKVSANIPFRFTVAQSDKLLPFDDIRLNEDNLFRAARTPAELPTWGRIAQMFANVSPTMENCESLKPTMGRHTKTYRFDQNLQIWR